MNILFDTLPTTIQIEGKEVPIKTDFRCWLRFAEIVQKYDLDNITVGEFVEMMEKIISTVFKDPEDIEINVSLFSNLLNFYVGFFERKDRKDKEESEKSFDFEIDADAIYASFVKEYGIRLKDTEMHWYEFRTLFGNLSDDTPIGKLIRLRTMKEEDVPKDKLTEFRKLKEEIALPSFGSYAEDENVKKKLREKLK